MTWLLYLVAALFMFAGAACLLLVAFQLPGTWIMLALAAVVEYCDRFYLPPDDRQTFGWWVLGLALGLAVIGEIIEFAAGAAGASRGGSTRRGQVGAIIGGIGGAFVFTPLFFFVPLVGALCGAVLGSFVGAVVGELSAEGATVRGSVKPGLGAAVGRVIGTTGKVAVAMAMWAVLSTAAFIA